VEDDLVAAFIARRPEALEAVYRRFARDLFSVARYVLGGSETAEDCVHDALLRVWHSRNGYTPARGSLRAYLIVCVRNEAVSRARSEARRGAREARAFRLQVVTEDTEIVDPYDAARVRDALARLPAEQRLPLERAYYGNQTHVEVARELGLPLGTVKSRIAAAMRKLHEDLVAQGRPA